MSRKDDLRAMLSGRGRELPSGNQPESKPAPIPHIRSGAVGAMGRSLGKITTAAEQARAMVAAGATVVELPAAKLVPSFIADRLADGGPDYHRLVKAIRESGQRSPVLVRPHPDGSDRYQIAFGHRRVRVLEELGRPVRAVVQNLSDEELVIIQGQENAARTDLSYIERGLFALALEEAGYDRQIIMVSLGMEKTQLSRLLALAHTVPRRVAGAIGPAPKAGRPRWVEMAERIKQPGATKKLDKLFEKPAFRQAESDDRFAQAFAALASAEPGQREAVGDAVTARDGRAIASFTRRKGVVTIAIDETKQPDFAAFVLERIPELFEAFADSSGSKAADA